MLEQLKKGTFRIHSVFEHTMNAIHNDQLITFGSSSLPEGINNVVTDLNHFSSYFKPGHCVSVYDEFVKIGKVLFSYTSENIRNYLPFEDTYDINNTHIENARKLIDFISEQEVLSVFSYDNKNTSQRYQFDRIATFLNTPSLETAKQIVGLGMGLTPIGDDVITGYLFARQALGNTVAWTEELLQFAYKKTNIISIKSLQEITMKQYTAFLITILDDFFHRGSLEEIQKWINYGATSGAALLTGFAQGILEEENYYETTSSL